MQSFTILPIVIMDNALKNELQKIKSTRDLIVDYTKLELDGFSILSKGDSFRKGTQWRVNGLSYPTYMVSVINSYRSNIVEPELDYRPHFVTAAYLFCYIELGRSVPDTIIRPTNYALKLVNLFAHFATKLDGEKEFNHKYLVETTDSIKLKDLLGKSAIDLIAAVDELHIEIKDNKCLIMYSHSVKKGDGATLIALAENLFVDR